jgi:hypothetical protein
MLSEAYNSTIESIDLSSDSENIHLALIKKDATLISDSLKFKHIHAQTVSATEWSISHGLNCFPSVTVVDATKTEVIGDVSYTNLNSLTIRFTAAFSGEAYLN